MDCTKGKTITAQGRDTPVPVGVGCERAGSPRPSSSDCSGPPVDIQAGVLERAIGSESVQEGRRQMLKKLKISPVREVKSAPTSPGIMAVFNLTWDEDEARSVECSSGKRKRMEKEDKTVVSSESRLATVIRKTIKKMEQEIRKIAMAAKERNTKKEIKEAAECLRSLSSQLTTSDAQALLQSMGRNSTVPSETLVLEDTEDVSTQTGASGSPNKELRLENEALKKRIKDLTEQLAAKNEESAKVTPERLKSVNNYDDFLKIATRPWDSSVYKRAFMVAGTPLEASRDTDIMVTAANVSAPGGEDRLRTGIEKRFPEIREMEGELSTLTISSTREDSKGRRTTEERLILRVDCPGSQRDWFSTLTLVRDKLVENRRNKIAICLPPFVKDCARMRKMLECLFHRTNIKCLVYGGPGDVRAQKPKARNTEALIISSESGKSFAEMLKMVKDTVKPGSTAAAGVRTLRKSRDGKLVIVVENSAANSINHLKREISATGADTVIKETRSGKKAQIYIRGIDALATKEEVLATICAEVGVVREEVKVGELRPLLGNNQAVTVTMDAGKAQKLIRASKIRIGLSLCTVAERTEVTQCYRCWGFGHTTNKCTGTDRSEACKKCGVTGHKRTECSGEMCCLSCGAKGHSVGMGSCPVFREALRLARIARYKSRNRSISPTNEMAVAPSEGTERHQVNSSQRL